MKIQHPLRLALALLLALILAACSKPATVVTPELTVTSGATATADGMYTLTGTVKPADAIEQLAYMLNDDAEVTVPITDGAFTASLSLTPGENTINITATAKGDRKASKTITVTFAPPEAHLAAITPDGGPAGTEVSVSGLFPANTRITICNEPLQNLILGEERNVHGQASTASGTVPESAPGTSCEVEAWHDGERLAGSATFTFDPARVLIASGSRLDLLEVTSNSTTPVSSAALPAGLDPEHAIFGLRQHPTQPWIYASSMHPDPDWLDARIDRFELTDSNLVYREGILLESLASLSCLADCAPTEMTFSPDGSRLYLHEDYNDLIVVFAVDLTSGALEFLFEADNDDVFMHGMAHHPREPYLYNGGSAYLLTEDAITNTHYGPGGNANTIAELNGTLVMFATLEYNEGFAAYDLTDPAEPTVLDEVNFIDEEDNSQKWGRFLALDHTAGRLLVVGDDRLTSYTFDGENLTERDQLSTDDEDGPRIYRSAAWAPGTDRAVATWFRKDGTGGYTVIEINPDGTLSLATDVNTGAPSRAATALR